MSAPRPPQKSTKGGFLGVLAQLAAEHERELQEQTAALRTEVEALRTDNASLREHRGDPPRDDAARDDAARDDAALGSPSPFAQPALEAQPVLEVPSLLDVPDLDESVVGQPYSAILPGEVSAPTPEPPQRRSRVIVTRPCPVSPSTPEPSNRRSRALVTLSVPAWTSSARPSLSSSNDVGREGEDFPVAWEFHLLPRSWVLARGEHERLSCFQELRDRGVLTRQQIHIRDVFLGNLRNSHAAVSYRWQTRDDPDTSGQRLKMLKLHLEQNASVQLVFLDWACLPQATRTPEEQRYFEQSLKMINLLYLGCRVFVIYDNQYVGRFWPCIEAWMGMQDLDERGLRPARSPERLRVQCIGAASGRDAEGEALGMLMKTWGRASVEEVIDRLDSDDILVTNASDKSTQLQRLAALHEQIGSLFAQSVSKADFVQLSRRRAIRCVTLARDFGTLRDAWAQAGAADARATPKSRSVALEIPDRQGSGKWMLPTPRHTGGWRQLCLPGRPLERAWAACAVVLALHDLAMLPARYALRVPQGGVVTAADWLALAFWTANAPVSLLGAVDGAGRPISQPRQLAVWYARRFLLWDLVVLAPNWALPPTEPSGTLPATGVQLVRLLRLLMFVRSSAQRLLMKANALLCNRMADKSALIWYLLLVAVVALLFLAHVSACLWCWLGIAPAEGVDTWLRRYSLQDEGWKVQYSTALYWALEQFTLSSSDLRPASVLEHSVRAAMAVIALVVFCALLDILTRLSQQVVPMERYMEMLQLRRFMHQRSVPLELRDRVTAYLDARHSQARRVQAQDVGLLCLLPEELAEELKCEITLPHIAVHPLFRQLSGESAATMQRVSREACSQKLLARGDAVFHGGEAALHAYFPVSGALKYLKEESADMGARYVDTAADWVAEPVLWTPFWVHLGTLLAAGVSELLLVEPEALAEAVRSSSVSGSVRTYAQRYLGWIASLSEHRLSDLSRDLCPEPAGLLPESPPADR